MRTLLIQFAVAFCGSLSLALCCAAALAQPLEDAPLLDDTSDDISTVEADKTSKRSTGNLLIAEFGLEERNVVLSAAKTRTTIQEAPAIVSVITAAEIRSRGYRTLNDLLQTIPGFEGNRWDSNGWTEESFARGQPRGLLILLNGVNIVDPIRNTLSLDRKIPMEAIKRIEIVSGPGGVLWGSNALLGIVNVITKDSNDLDGFEAIIGGGSGPGELEAAKIGLSFGGEFFENRLKVYSHASFFSSRGAELRADNQKVVGVLPTPSPDGTSIFLSGSTLTEPSREFFINWIGQVGFEQFTLEWMLPWEQDSRQLATGGAVLTADYRDSASLNDFAFNVESKSSDSARVLALRFQDRFANDNFGLSAKIFGVSWELKETPFGAFAPSSLSPRTAAGVFSDLESRGVLRYGLNLDMDLVLPGNNNLTFGGELLRDQLDGVESRSPIDQSLLASLTPEQQRNVSFEGSADNPIPLFKEFIVNPAERNIGAFYLRNELKASADLALSAGARLQISDSYDPTVLLSAAMVLNVANDTFMKLNLTEGFRPPNFQSTATNNDSINTIRFKANPDLEIERSRAGEIEINSVLLKSGRLINRLYVRADFALTLLDDVIIIDRGEFQNSGTRLIHSTEFLGRLELRGKHELWAGHQFVQVEDSETGMLRNIANHTIHAGAKAMIIPETWELSSILTWIGPREDRNRAIDPEREPFAVFDGNPYLPIYPTDVTIDRMDPVWLLRFGTRVIELYDTFTLSAFGYNVLNQSWADPDLFFDDRIMTRPFPKPRWSVFTQVEASF